MAPGVEPVKVPGYHTDYTEGHSDEFIVIPYNFHNT